MDGESLYRIFEREALKVGNMLNAWSALPMATQYIWAATARELTELVAAGAFAGPAFMLPTCPVVSTPDWKGLLKHYGRHGPGCPIGACSCGFEAIEKELAA